MTCRVITCLKAFLVTEFNKILSRWQPPHMVPTHKNQCFRDQHCLLHLHH